MSLPACVSVRRRVLECVQGDSGAGKEKPGACLGVTRVVSPASGQDILREIPHPFPEDMLFKGELSGKMWIRMFDLNSMSINVHLVLGFVKRYFLDFKSCFNLFDFI